jgi:hypothetical protein
MKQFTSVIKEINRTLTELILFENIVNATLIFLVFYFLLSVFDFKALYALIPAIAYLAFFSYVSFASSKPLIVESKYAPLREKLRTAADNISLDNPVVDELEYEVTSEMRNVGLSMFINPRTLSYKILCVILISFLIIFTTTSNIKFIDFAKQKALNIFDTRAIKGVGNFVATKLETKEDIYGKEDVARLGDKELDIRIKPVDFKVNVKEEGEWEQRNFQTTFPQEAVVKESVAFEENIPQEQQELVKNYFKKLAEG